MKFQQYCFQNKIGVMMTPGDKPTWIGTCNNNEEIMILEVRGDMGGVEGEREAQEQYRRHYACEVMIKI